MATFMNGYITVSKGGRIMRRREEKRNEREEIEYKGGEAKGSGGKRRCERKRG